MSTRRTILGLGLLPAFALGGSTPPPSDPTPAPAKAVEPTVTAASGDLGNKINGRPVRAQAVRRYYVAAEPELWDYVPEGRDSVCGKTLPPTLVQRRSVGKVRYVEYTDETFTARVLDTPRLGILGPVLRGVVGEQLAVTFLNRTSRPLSMHPHGVKYDKDSEGSYYEPNPGLGAAVGPNARYTYVWLLDEASGPRPDEPSSKVWLYHSHVNGDEESNLGLVGAIVVTDPKRARPDGTPRDVDREMAVLFMIFDESGMGEAEREAAEVAAISGKPGNVTPWWQVQQTIEQGERPALNGYMFGNLPGLDMIEGERVRWYLLGLGGQKDFHTAHWHGARVLEGERRGSDVVELMPASMKVADMRADNPGAWLFHCHVSEHMTEGMFARFTIHPKDANPAGPMLETRFLGLPGARASMRVRRAVVTLDAAGRPAVELAGAVTVFQAYAIFRRAMALTLNGRTTSFTTDGTGAGTADGLSFRVTNASRFGVVYGGVMEFELKLSGDLVNPAWLRLTAAPAGIDAPLVLQIDGAVHRATARLRPNRAG